MPPPKPSLLAANLCDMAIQEGTTGKWSLIGLFGGILVQSLPAVQPQMAVYFCLTGAQGEYDFQIELAYLNEDQVLGRVEGKLVAGDRFKPAEVGITLRGIPFTKAGRYAFRLTMNGQFIGDKPFEIKVMNSKKES